MNDTEMTNNNDNNQSTGEEANQEEPISTEQREDNPNESPVAEDITPAVTWTSSTEDSNNNETDASSKTDAATSGDHTESESTIESGAIITPPFVEDPIVALTDMKRLTNPEMACVVFNDGNKDIICCTHEKMDDSEFIVNRKEVIVIEELYSGQSVIPREKIIEVSLVEGDEDRLCKYLVRYAAELAFHSSTSTVLLVCEDASHFGDVASIIASFYLLFRNLDVNTFLYRIQRAFCDQCPLSFGRSYVMQGLSTRISALCRIQQATDIMVFDNKNVGSIVGEVYERFNGGEDSEEIIDRLYRLKEGGAIEELPPFGFIGPEEEYYALLAWVRLGSDRLKEEYPKSLLRSDYVSTRPSSALIHKKEVADTNQDCPDWIGKYCRYETLPDWVDEDVRDAVIFGSIPACSFLLSKLGRDAFFLCKTDSFKERTPLYLAAKLGDLPLVCWMLCNGGDIYLEKESRQKTPLFAACKNSFHGSLHLDVIKVLILHGAAMSGSTFLGKSSVLGYTSRQHAEELRTWIKKCLITLQHQQMDSTKLNLVKHLQVAHRSVLEYYHELYQENNDPVDVSLDSLDHGNHDFLKDTWSYDDDGDDYLSQRA